MIAETKMFFCARFICIMIYVMHTKAVGAHFPFSLQVKAVDLLLRPDESSDAVQEAKE